MTEHDRTGPAAADPRTVGPGTGSATTDVVVLGGGLAGLTAAVSAARGGARVTLLEGRALGGRAATTTVDPGVVFNSGPRAFYRSGVGADVLAELGIRPRGGTPDAAHGRVLHDGALHPMPGGPGSLLRTSLLSARSKLAAARLLGGLARLDAAGVADRSVAQWMRDRRYAPDLCELLAMLVRTSTYCSDLEVLSADAALRQLQLALGDGVSYLDGGFQQLVDALADEAVRAGVTILEHLRVDAVHAVDRHAVDAGDGTTPLRWTVSTGAGSVHAAAVVLATGGPDSVRALSPVALEVDGLGAAATAACLELAVRGPIAQPIVLGDGVPLYLSVHQPPADLAPEGISVVHAMRYGARTSDEDRAELWELAALGGIHEDRVVAHRFLHRMIVMGGVPTAAAGGLAGRPAVRVAGADGLFLAGDWVGPEGLLADAALHSGRDAGRAAAATSGPAAAMSGAAASAVGGATRGRAPVARVDGVAGRASVSSDAAG